VIPLDATFDGSFPFAPHVTTAPGFAMHYVDEGPRDAQGVVLCLHGEPSWAYLFRHLIAGLRGRHRVVVPDHMGFGKSETPQDRSYLLQDHIDNLERFVLDLDLRGITLVLHDFGGPMGMGLAAQHPDRIARIVAANGPTPFGQADVMEPLMANADHAPWFQWIVKAHADGTLEQVLGQLHVTMLSILKLNGFERNAVIIPTWLEAWRAPFATPAECLGAIGWTKGFATGAHRFEVPDAAAGRAIRVKPAMAIWGEADQTLQARFFLPQFTALFPDAPVHRLPGVGHYAFEDAPEAITGLIENFLDQT